MSTITSLHAELNELCKQYVFNNDDFSEQVRIRELIIKILENDFDFEIVNSKKDSPVCELLSEKGKLDYNTMLEIKKLKLEAIHQQQYEHAAYLRDKERQLTNLINTEYIQSANKLFFLLKEQSSNIVLFIDFERMLKGMFTNCIPESE